MPSTAARLTEGLCRSTHQGGARGRGIRWHVRQRSTWRRVSAVLYSGESEGGAGSVMGAWLISKDAAKDARGPYRQMHRSTPAGCLAACADCWAFV